MDSLVGNKIEIFKTGEKCCMVKWTGIINQQSQIKAARTDDLLLKAFTRAMHICFPNMNGILTRMFYCTQGGARVLLYLPNGGPEFEWVVNGFAMPDIQECFNKALGEQFILVSFLIG